jgi:Fic-DOC domain mobile mystery protein B
MGWFAVIFDEPSGATPLDSDEAAGLRLTHITTRGELNRWEQENIAAGETWAFGRRQQEILEERFMRQLHKRMFGEVWRWAGEFRRSGKNIGVDRLQIPIELRKLCDDVRAWLEFDSYPADEIAARFHHRLVSIHPFANGNGRHARTMTDLLLVQRLGMRRFSWGRENLTNPGEVRRRYINALRTADRGDYGELLAFVRS